MIALVLMLALSAVPDGGKACSVNLCGDPMMGEQACYCHGSPKRRCWDTDERCEADAACVEADPDAGRRLCAEKVKKSLGKARL